jgi:Mn2+/Fe2+ NRAMP family transporter
MVACAAAIWEVRPRHIEDAAQAAKALRPFGEYSYVLFSAGLLNASLFAASILPLSTAYTVCEGLGFESGVNRRFREAPIFYWLYTLLIVIGAAVVLLPGLPLIRVILFSQVINGMLLPFVLIFMILLVNKTELMGEWVNPRLYNFIAWISVAMLIGLTLALTGITVRSLGD